MSEYRAATFRSPFYGKSLFQTVHRPGQQGVFLCRANRAPAGLDDRYRHHYHALAGTRLLLVSGRGGGDVRLFHGAARAADRARSGSLRPTPSAAVCHRDQRDRPLAAADLHSLPGAGLGAVRLRCARGRHAQHLCDGQSSLERNLSRHAAAAHGIFIRVGVGRSRLYHRPADRRGAQRFTFPRSRPSGGRAASGGGRHGIRLAKSTQPRFTPATASGSAPSWLCRQCKFWCWR